MNLANLSLFRKSFRTYTTLSDSPFFGDFSFLSFRKIPQLGCKRQQTSVIRKMATMELKKSKLIVVENGNLLVDHSYSSSKELLTNCKDGVYTTARSLDFTSILHYETHLDRLRKISPKFINPDWECRKDFRSSSSSNRKNRIGGMDNSIDSHCDARIH